MLNYIFHTMADAQMTVDTAALTVYGYTIRIWFGFKLSGLPLLFDASKSWFEAYQAIVHAHWSISVANIEPVFGSRLSGSLLDNAGLHWPRLVVSGEAPNPFAAWSKVTAKAAESMGVPLGAPVAPGTAEVLSQVGSGGGGDDLHGSAQHNMLPTVGRYLLPPSLLAARHFVSSIPSLSWDILQGNLMLLLVTYLVAKDFLRARFFRTKK